MPKQVSPAKGTGSKGASPKRRLPKVTTEGKRAIDEYLRSLAFTVDAKSEEFRRLAKRIKSPTIDGQLAYWQSVAKGFRWAIAVNKQRKVHDA